MSNEKQFEIGENAFLSKDCFCKPVTVVDYVKMPVGGPESGREIITGYYVKTQEGKILEARDLDVSRDKPEGRIVMNI